MKNIFKKTIILTLFLSILLPLTSNIHAQESKSQLHIATYFTGIGCPHCSSASPYIKEILDEDENFMLVEYEVYEEIRNAALIEDYNDEYNIGRGIPVLFFDKDTKLVGGSEIKNNLKLNLSTNTNINTIHLSDGVVGLKQLNINNLKGYPKIYRKDRVAMRESITTLTQDQNDQIVSFLTDDLANWTKEIWEGELVTPQVVKYPGGSSTYHHALKFNGWVLQWNGEIIQAKAEVTDDSEFCDEEKVVVCEEPISLAKILGLALADSINPCAISVLLLMLLAITTYNPKDRKQILLSGLAFVLAVIVMYMFYGFLIIKAFQFLQSLSVFKEFLYKGLAIIALILGTLELKDYFKYKPGTAGTEMPISLRPKMQKFVSKITSPFGAFSMGLFVTLFLLPCTIGPYVILGGMLSTLDFLKSVPYLLTYNIIFVLPMILITFLIFWGTKDIKDVTDWRNTNVRRMHLISGILMIALGIIMFFGLL
ncbi:hypothetical protein K8R20_02415 [bacterium]|nr:hypothetical protein [bacterium]